MADEAAELHAFIEAAGAGLSDAQRQIAGAELATTAMAVNEATLEAKVLLDIDAKGAVRVAPVDREQIASLGVGAQALSTVTVNFVALTTPDTPATAPTSPIGRDDAIQKLAERDDVARLAAALGPLRFDATLVPERAAWLVAAFDGAGRRVREVLVVEED